EVKRIGSAAVWDTKVLLDRIALLDGLLKTMAKADDRMTFDIAQFNLYRPQIEKFIKNYGLSKQGDRKPLPLGFVPDEKQVPVIVTSDLFYPPTAATTDAFFGYAVLSTMPEADVKGVVLGNALKGQDRPQVDSMLATPGALVTAQIQTILRQRTPAVI